MLDLEPLVWLLYNHEQETRCGWIAPSIHQVRHTDAGKMQFCIQTCWNLIFFLLHCLTHIYFRTWYLECPAVHRIDIWNQGENYFLMEKMPNQVLKYVLMYLSKMNRAWHTGKKNISNIFSKAPAYTQKKRWMFYPSHISCGALHTSFLFYLTNQVHIF